MTTRGEDRQIVGSDGPRFRSRNVPAAGSRVNEFFSGTIDHMRRAVRLAAFVVGLSAGVAASGAMLATAGLRALWRATE